MLDLYCCAGGASWGYHRAGFDVVGWDLHPQPRYPLLEVHQGDALAVLRDVEYVRTFDAVHASPPCKGYTTLRHLAAKSWPDLLTPTRELLRAAGVPYVIENVVGAPLLDPVTLCGSMFGLGRGTAVLRRHRLFEASFRISAPEDACAGRDVVGVYGTGGAWTRTAPGGGGVKVSGQDAADVLGITWHANQGDLCQAIPPAYTEHIGAQLLAHVSTVRHAGTT